ncbi:MAG TPA: CcmD family protein [Candidatus Polarisedimenticolia bacterium]|nr:CcmD family protein [Candidatus Polarisedimenticolia bacterium]
MSLFPLPSFAHHLIAAVQETLPPGSFSAETAETVAARPEVAARGFRYLIGAYSAVWTILALYLLTLSIRLRRLSNQVRRLRERAGL